MNMDKRINMILIIIMTIIFIKTNVRCSDTYSEIRYWGPKEEIVEYVPIDGYFAETMEVYDSVIIDTLTPYETLKKIIEQDTQQMSFEELRGIISAKLTALNKSWNKTWKDTKALYIANLDKINYSNNEVVIPSYLIHSRAFPHGSYYIYKDYQNDLYIDHSQHVPESKYLAKHYIVKINTNCKIVLILPLLNGKNIDQSLGAGLDYYIDYHGNIYYIYEYKNIKNEWQTELIKYTIKSN